MKTRVSVTLTRAEIVKLVTQADISELGEMSDSDVADVEVVDITDPLEERFVHGIDGGVRLRLTYAREDTL